MKINRQSVQILISRDEKLLYNVGGTASIFDISNEKAVEMRRFNKLSHSSNIAVSSNEKLIAYKNTSGHIAVHDIETGELLLKSKCLSKEGNDMYFINNDKQIISSEWHGKVFILDIETRRTTVIAEFPIFGINIIPINDNRFIVFGSGPNKYTHIYDLLLTEEKVSSKELCSTHQYRIKEVCAAVSDKDIFFFARIMKSDKSAIISFNTSTYEICPCFNVEKLLGFKVDLIAEYGYFTSICISKDKRYILIGLSDTIITVDLLEKKVIGIFKLNYVTSLHLIASDTKVVIGTYTNFQIIDFSTLLFNKNC